MCILVLFGVLDKLCSEARQCGAYVHVFVLCFPGTSRGYLSPGFRATLSGRFASRSIVPPESWGHSLGSAGMLMMDSIVVRRACGLHESNFDPPLLEFPPLALALLTPVIGNAFGVGAVELDAGGGCGDSHGSWGPVELEGYAARGGS